MGRPRWKNRCANVIGIQKWREYAEHLATATSVRGTSVVVGKAYGESVGVHDAFAEGRGTALAVAAKEQGA